MSQLDFTKDWFSQNIPAWHELFSQLPTKLRFLEIGSFEGRSACWLMQNALEDDGEMVCIDTWKGSPEHDAMDIDMDRVYLRFVKNTARSKKPDQNLVALRGESFPYLGSFLANKEKFDFIYVDGHHFAPYVITDAIMSTWLLNKGGLMVMDDYLWGKGQLPVSRRPKEAIDAFLTLFEEEVDLVQLGNQIAIRKR